MASGDLENRRGISNATKSSKPSTVASIFKIESGDSSGIGRAESWQAGGAALVIGAWRWRGQAAERGRMRDEIVNIGVRRRHRPRAAASLRRPLFRYIGLISPWYCHDY